MSEASPLERLMLDLVNKERREAGLDELRLELRLNDSSEDHSDWMLDVDRFSHTGKGDSSAGDRMSDAGFEFEGRWTWGENIAFQSERGASGLTDDVRDLHDALMDSPGHRANILKPEFEVMGIGIERGEYKGYDTVMVTQNFARTAAPMQIDGGAGGAAPMPKPAPAPTPASEPSGGEEPEIAVRDLVLRPGQFTPVSKLVSYEDADGDAPLRWELDAPDGARVVIGNRTVDMSDGRVLTPDEFGRTYMQFDRGGRDQDFRLRVDDGDGWSDWNGFTLSASGGGSRPAPKPQPGPDGGGALDVAVGDFSVAAGARVKLADHLDVTDMARAEAFRIVDPDGGANLWMAHLGEIDASGGFWIGKSAIDKLYVEGGPRASVDEMRILVFGDGERSDYDAFTVTTEWDGA